MVVKLPTSPRMTIVTPSSFATKDLGGFAIQQERFSAGDALNGSSDISTERGTPYVDSWRGTMFRQKIMLPIEFGVVRLPFYVQKNALLRDAIGGFGANHGEQFHVIST